ncbi:MAG TPA: hypothetical protein VIS29_14290 [Streptomyces sp.]
MRSPKADPIAQRLTGPYGILTWQALDEVELLEAEISWPGPRDCAPTTFVKAYSTHGCSGDPEDNVPLRLELGFEIGGAWVDRERDQFVWLVSYDGPETFAERNALYWASHSRKAMNLDPDDYLLAPRGGSHHA